MSYLKEIVRKYNSLNIVVKASIWFTMCSLIQKGISIITLPIFTRLMSPSEYGNYSIYTSWYNIFLIFLTLNIHKEIFNKGLIENENDKDEYTTNQMGLLTVLCALAYLMYILLQSTINKITGLSFLLISLLFLEVFSNGIISFWMAKKRFSYEYKKIVLTTMLIAVLNPILGIVFVLFTKYKVEARVLSIVIAPIIFSIIILINNKKYKFFNNKMWWRKAIQGSLPLIPHYMSLVLLNQSDKLMINHFFGSSDAAIYSIAHTAGLLMVFVNEALNNAFVPWAYKKIKSNKSNELKKMITPLLCTVLFSNLILIWIAPEFVSIFAPLSYRGAIWCIVPIAVSVYCTFIYTLFVDIEIYYNGNIYVTIGSIIATIVNIILNYIFIPKFGYIAASYTTFISYFLTAILHYYFLSIILRKNNKKQNMFNIKMIIALFFLLAFLSAIALLTYRYVLIRYLFVIISIIVSLLNKNKIITIIKKMKA